MMCPDEEYAPFTLSGQPFAESVGGPGGSPQRNAGDPAQTQPATVITLPPWHVPSC